MPINFVNNGSDIKTWRYITKSMPTMDILKSMNRVGLVQVQRTISSTKGGTFTRIYWVKADKVKKTDRIMGRVEDSVFNNSKAYKVTGKGGEADEHYKFFTVSSEHPISDSTEIEDGITEDTKQNVVNVVSQLSTMLESNIEKSIANSTHIGTQEMNRLDDNQFQQKYHMTKEEYMANHHIALPEHFNIKPQVKTLTKKRIRVVFQTNIDAKHVTEGTKKMLQAAFAHDQIKEVQFRVKDGKLAIRLKIFNKSKKSQPTVLTPSKPKPASTIPKSTPVKPSEIPPTEVIKPSTPSEATKPAQVELPKTETAPAIPPRNYDSQLAQGIGKQYYDAVRDITEKVNHTASTLWMKYETRMRVGSVTSKGNYHSSGSLYLNMAKNSKGTISEYPYEVVFHEGAHLIDFLHYNKVKHLPYSASYNDGAFLKAIHEEVPQFIEKYSLDRNEIAKDVRKRFKAGDVKWFEQQADAIWGADKIQEYKKSIPNKLTFKSTDPYAKDFIKTMTDGVLFVNKQKLKKEYGNDLRSLANISDIVNGATNGKLSFGGAHPKSYWKQKNKYGIDYGTAQEAFANIYECVMANPDGLAVIKTHLPKTYKVFEEMMEDLKKNGVEK